MKGYYVRPSRAIEKGGGFFVPGLEGDRSFNLFPYNRVALLPFSITN